MSAANVEAVRRVYERWSHGDFQAGMELYDPYVAFVLRPEFPEAGPHYGLEGIRKYMLDDFLKDFPDATISGEEFIDVGDSVVVQIQQRATGPRSGAAVHMRYFHVWTFRGSSVVRLECIMERGDALEAVGLADH